MRPFDFARRADPAQIFNFIQNEHPQTIALILSYLEAGQAGVILSSLPQEVQADIAKRIAVMESTSPEVISEIESVLERKLSSTVTQDYTETGGIDAVVEVLNGVDRQTEKQYSMHWKYKTQNLQRKSKTYVCVRGYCYTRQSFHSACYS